MPIFRVLNLYLRFLHQKRANHRATSPVSPLTVGSSKLTISAVRSSPSRVSYPLCHKPGRSRIRLSAHRPQPLGPATPPSVLRSSGCCAGHRPTPRSGNAKTSGRSGRDPVVVPAASRWVRPLIARRPPWLMRSADRDCSIFRSICFLVCEAARVSGRARRPAAGGWLHPAVSTCRR